MSETSLLDKIYAQIKGIDISEITPERILQDLRALCKSEKPILQPSECSDDCGTLVSISNAPQKNRLKLIKSDEIETPEEIEQFLENFFRQIVQ